MGPVQPVFYQPGNSLQFYTGTTDVSSGNVILDGSVNGTSVNNPLEKKYLAVDSVSGFLDYYDVAGC